MHYNFINIILDFIYQFTRSRRKIRSIRDTKSGTCIIVGNGPSLNKTDFQLVSKFDSFGLNRIHLMYNKTVWRPNYLVAVNHLVLRGLHDEEVLTKNTFVTFTFKLKNILTGKGVGMNHRNRNITPFVTPLERGIEIGSTVTFVAMQLAFHMGYDTILLVGVDHSFKQQGRPNERQKLNGADVNHFSEDYFSGQEWQLADLENSEVHYCMAREWAKANGKRIYDCTVDGKLEVFPKRELQEFL